MHIIKSSKSIFICCELRKLLSQAVNEWAFKLLWLVVLRRVVWWDHSDIARDKLATAAEVGI